MAPEHVRQEKALYGIGEWYGLSFAALTSEQRQVLAQEQVTRDRPAPQKACPFRGGRGQSERCSKRGGVCSLRLYRREAATGRVFAVGEKTGLHTLCPYRFYEDQRIFRWIGKEILGTRKPAIVKEVGFLEQTPRGGEQTGTQKPGHVGRIDHVLVRPESEPLTWCALEMQAVYFSGAKMETEFQALAAEGGELLPFPAGRRRPDYRSSGPKRLMPQLQIKVPTLRRWGKKMCVVVDRGFFDELGRMERVSDVSSCDIAWFVVKYREEGSRFTLVEDEAYLTTLERAVEGLTAGTAVSLQTFEERIRAKMKGSARRPASRGPG